MTRAAAPPDAEALLAAAVGALGEEDLPDRLLALVGRLSGADLLSAFAVGPEATLTCVLAAGRHPEIPRFADVASLAYATRYWQRDRVTRRLVAGPEDEGTRVVRQAATDIADPEYRHACYERAGVVERVTIYGPRPTRLLVSAYRIRGGGRFEPNDLETLERLAPVVLALVDRHARLRRSASPTPLHPAEDDVVRTLLAAGRNLSTREAEVAAGLLVGRTQREISARSGIALTSIVTYRQRAYRKLGVADRGALAALYPRLADDPFPPSPKDPIR